MAQAFAQEAPAETVVVTPEGTVTTDHPAGKTVAGTEAHGGVEDTGAFPPFDTASFGNQLIWLAITFGILYLIMSRVALPRIGSVLATRKARIDADLNEADMLRQQTDAAVAKYEADLAAARAGSNAIAEETRQAIKAELDGKRRAVEDNLAHTMGEAEKRIQTTKAEALGHVGEIAAETAQAIVARLVGNVSTEAARDAVRQVSGS